MHKLKSFDVWNRMLHALTCVLLLTQEDAHDLIRQWLDATQRQLTDCITQV